MERVRGVSIQSTIIAAMALAGVLTPCLVHGQTESYPARAVRLVVPFPPGGSLDFNARLIAPKMSELLGQQLVVDNRAGASGTIATSATARAAPDGYTLLLHTVPFVTAPILYSRAGYDPVADFAPISLLSHVPMAISVHPSLPVRSVKELIALAKSRPGELNYASAGIGTNSHITGELFNLLARAGVTPVHFKGGGPALASVVSGEVHVAFSNVPQTSIMVAAKRLRPLAVSSLKRSPGLPDVPPAADVGLPGFEFVGWHGLLAPKGTPLAIVAQLNEKLRATVSAPDLKPRFEQAGLEVVTNSPSEFAAYLKSEQEKWRRVIRERNIRAE